MYFPLEMETLTRCIDLIHSDSAPYVYSLRTKAGADVYHKQEGVTLPPLDTKLVQMFDMELRNFQTLLEKFSKQDCQTQRLALETVKNEVEQLSQLISIGNDRRVTHEIEITNGHILWYIQKMMELRVSAAAWAKEKGIDMH
jgi:hypothetical protein